MKGCHLIPHLSTVLANAKASISQQRLPCVRDRDLGLWLRRYLIRGRKGRMEKVKERSPWTKVSEVNIGFFYSPIKWGRGLG